MVEPQQRYSSWVLERKIINETHRLRLGINKIGRHSTANIRITDSTYVSRHHAEIEVSMNDQCVNIRDVKSVNGVFVNKALYNDTTISLSTGDHIGIGVSSDGCEGEDELTLPIYELKFLPISRGRKTSATTTQLVAASREQTEKITTTSTGCNKVKIEEIFIISDDEDSKEKVDVKQEKSTTNETPCIDTSLDFAIEKVKIEKTAETKKSCNEAVKESPMQTNQQNLASATSTDIKDKPKEITISKNVEQSISTSSIEALQKNAEITLTDKDKNVSNKPLSSLHIPIIPNLKKELIHSVSVDVQDIFGELDDEQNDALKELNPFVYNELNGKPLMPTANVDNHLFVGESITISDNEEEIKSAKSNEAVKCPQTTDMPKSPDILETSLNDSKECDVATALEVIKNHLNERQSNQQQVLDNNNDDLEDHTSYLPLTDDEDEDFMFSQAIFNDMKAELPDDINKEFDSNINEAPNQDAPLLPVQIKEEPDLLGTPLVFNEMDNSLWVISDDEDYDQELETKVSDWSKILSQSVQFNNMSQVYEINSDTSDNEDIIDNESITTNSDRIYLGDEELDDIANLYNSHNEVQSIEDAFERPYTTTECVNNEKNNNIVESKKISSDETDQVANNKIFVHNIVHCKKITSTETGQVCNNKISPEELALHSHKEKSPEIIQRKPQIVQTESPLIRIRRKSFTKGHRFTSISSSEDEAEDVADKISAPKVTTNNTTEMDISTKHSSKRQVPQIIEAPSLPKCKGKLRGVSAEKPPPVIKKTATTKSKKPNTLRENLQDDRKRKWLDKPSLKEGRDREQNKKIKDCRRDELKKLAEKTSSHTNDNIKRKHATTTNIDEENKAKKLKVKVTENNRGAFLAEAPQPPPPKPKESKKETFKIPKVIAKKPDEKKHSEPLKRSNSIDELKKKEPPKRSYSIDGHLPTFSQEISKLDSLLLKQTELKSSMKQPEQKSIVQMREEASIARAAKITNKKLSFASMEKNIHDSEKNKNILQSLCNKRNKSDEQTSSLAATSKKKKKTVRFIDTPIIHYIERISGVRQVNNCKDSNNKPLSEFKNRRNEIRHDYPILDNTEKIISQILNWSNEWLIKRNAAADAASDIVYPMPTYFTSFDHYKSIMFPLMKLEFATVLEREFNHTLGIKKYKVTLENVAENRDRLMLITKNNEPNQQNSDASKYDLVILESKQMNREMFAYVSAFRRGAGSCNTIVFEIIPKNITREFFRGVKEFSVRPVIDNARVEFGAYNAVYQVEATPLFNRILNPMELLKYRVPSKRKIRYCGCDRLNEKQTQVLLNTYERVIDETTPTISLLQGPPGTGKSCVISNLVLQTLYGAEVRDLDQKILICAQSNAAVDVIASKLHDICMRMREERRFHLIRYGLTEKMKPSLYPVSLPYLLKEEQMKKLKKYNPNVTLENKENLRMQMIQLEASIADLKKRNIQGTVDEHTLLEKERELQLMRNISNQSTRPEDERSISAHFLNNANIVCATLSSCVKLSQYVNYFDVCIIDEATQCTEPWTLLPLRFGIRALVLVGDTQQLPATVLSKKANELGLGKSLFTRIQNCLDNVPTSTANGTITPNHIIYSLQTQYRMNPEICKWPNQYFYRNELINGGITLQYKSPLMPFSVLNLAYTQNDKCTNGKITNNLEAEFVAKLLKALDGFIPNRYNSYGVITPYAHHRMTLETSIRALGLTNIMVNTIDSYQGLEKDVIVISNARTNGIGFLSNPQRLNVALTRPKKCLILCGNFKNLEIVPAWRCLLQSARERKVYHEISTNCVNDMQTNVIEKIKIRK